MTTRDKGITYPVLSSFVSTDSALGAKTTNVANDYTVKQAWAYGAGVSQPVNPSPLTAVGPTLFTFIGQDATVLLASQGGGITFKAGVGTGGNVDGNIQFQNTLGLGAGWNTAHLILGSNFHFWIDAKNRLRTKVGVPANDTDGNVVSLDAVASAVYDPANLADGAGVTTTIALAGAALGDMVIGSFSLDIQGILVTYYVSAVNTIAIRFQNETGGAIDLGSGTINVKLIKL